MSCELQASVANLGPALTFVSPCSVLDAETLLACRESCLGGMYSSSIF